MKIERINENQIRCTLTSFDLSVRNLNLVELAYGTEKARKLFREMIQKASNEVGFEAEDIPLMVEAIPLSPESIMLVITKIEDPEELDTRFSKFTPASEEGGQSLLSQLAGQLLEGVGALSAQFEDGGEHFRALPPWAAGSLLRRPMMKRCGFSALTVWTVCARAPLPSVRSITDSTAFIKSRTPASTTWYLRVRRRKRWNFPEHATFWRSTAPGFQMKKQEKLILGNIMN